MKRAIVTGATGFIGSHLCKKLLDDDWSVSVISRKTSDYTSIMNYKELIDIYEYDGKIAELINFFRDKKADVVFHLASVSIVEHTSNQVDSLVNSNIRFGLHILEAMKESKTNLLINTGTYWQHYNDNEYSPVNLYAATKEAFTNLIKYYSDVEGLRVITLKLFDTYGESDTRGKLINLLFQFSNNAQLLTMSPGDQLIDLVHIEDVINAFISAYKYLHDNDSIRYDEFAVASGRRVTIKELVNLFEHASNKKINIKWGGRDYRKREVMNPWNSYKTLPNWKSNISLEDGLQRFVKKNMLL